MAEVTSLAEALQNEITRARGIQDLYKEIAKDNPLVGISVSTLEMLIQGAIKALSEGDAIGCMVAYDRLKEVE